MNLHDDDSFLEAVILIFIVAMLVWTIRGIIN